MGRTWWHRLVAVAVIAFGAVACGGGGGDQWREEASDLCADWVDEVEDPDLDDADDLVETTEEFADDLEDLDTPGDLQDQVDDVIDDLNAVAAFYEAAGNLVEDLEFPDGDELTDGADAIEDVVDAGEELDLDCDLAAIEVQAGDLDLPDDFGSDSSDDLTSDFSDDASSDFSDDFSDDLSDDVSDDFSDDLPDDLEFGDAVDPEIFIPEFGDNQTFDALALQCYDNDLSACDQLYFQSPVAASTSSYEGYGATCGGRLAEERPGECVELGGG
jgi:hypothetical protein